MTPTLIPRLLVGDAVTIPYALPPDPEPISSPVVAESMQPLESTTRFEFTADFTGQLGSLGSYRFKPMVRVERDHRYLVVIDPATGATTFTPLGPDRYADAKRASAKADRHYRQRKTF